MKLLRSLILFFACATQLSATTTTPAQQVQDIINSNCTQLQNWMQTELQKYNSGALSKSQVQSDFSAERNTVAQSLNAAVQNLANQYSNSASIWSTINAANPWGALNNYADSIQSQTINALWNGTTPVIPPAPGGSSSQAQALQSQIASIYSTAKTTVADDTTLQKDFQTASSFYQGLSSSEQQPFSSQMNSITSQVQALPTIATLQTSLNSLSTLNTQAMQTTDLTTLNTILGEAQQTALTFPSDSSIKSLDSSILALYAQMQQGSSTTLQQIDAQYAQDQKAYTSLQSAFSSLQTLYNQSTTTPTEQQEMATIKTEMTNLATAFSAIQSDYNTAQTAPSSGLAAILSDITAKSTTFTQNVGTATSNINTLTSQLQTVPPTPSGTIVSIKGKDFYINGQITHPNTPQQGMLPNARMVQGIFDDSNSATVSKWVYPDTKVWDPNRNTQELVNAIPTYKSFGLLAITVGLQGGGPINGQFTTNQPWTNTAFNSDGSLKPAYLTRLDKIIRALDKNGMVLILNFFYRGQQNRLSSDQAVIAGVDHVTDWVLSQGYTNVIFCLANEASSATFPSHPILQPTPSGLPVLIQRVQTRSNRKILVTANVDFVVSSVVQAGDLVIIHGNSKSLSQLPGFIQSYRSLTSKPILINEDSTDIAKYKAAVSAGASWGYYDQGQNNYKDGYQSPPVNWGVNTSLKQAFFNEVSTLSK